MKNLLLIITGAMVWAIIVHYTVPKAHAQSTYFTGPLGEPRGQAWSSGNQTNVTSQIGIPMGSATNLTGGAPPVGVAITPLPQLQPLERIQPIQQIQPLQPLGR